MSTVELEAMRCEVDGPLAQLRLNRPEVLNTANRAWVQDLVTATDYLAHRCAGSLAYPFQRKSTHDGSTSAFSLQSTHQIGGVQVSA